MPTEPKNLTVYHLDQESIKLSWNSIGNYSLNKIQYIITCYKCIHSTDTDEDSPNSMCTNKVLCQNSIQFIPDRNKLFNNQYEFFFNKFYFLFKDIIVLII